MENSSKKYLYGQLYTSFSFDGQPNTHAGNPFVLPWQLLINTVSIEIFTRNGFLPAYVFGCSVIGKIIQRRYFYEKLQGHLYHVMLLGRVTLFNGSHSKFLFDYVECHLNMPI